MKTILITGATSGIGLAAAEEMAARGWYVLGTGRSEDHCRTACASILRFYPNARLSYKVADLSAQRDVHRLAAEVLHDLEQNSDGRLDVLLNNAGTVRNGYMATEDGYETQFAVNHLAGFLLTHLLRDALRRSPASRVLTVSSNSHRGAHIFWQDVMLRKNYGCLRAYKQSKLCNVLFTQAFNRRETGRASSSPIRAFAVDPGLVNTEIGLKGTTGLVAWFWKLRRSYGLSPYQAAATVVHLCKMPDDWQPDGIYYRNCAAVTPDRRALDSAAADRLWDLSARLCSLPAEGSEAASTSR
jgi:NAD(P)-dependent dehydrogenase (short-subunit alcohol dehydrogenase family)